MPISRTSQRYCSKDKWIFTIAKEHRKYLAGLIKHSRRPRITPRWPKRYSWKLAIQMRYRNRCRMIATTACQESWITNMQGSKRMFLDNIKYSQTLIILKTSQPGLRGSLATIRRARKTTQRIWPRTCFKHKVGQTRRAARITKDSLCNNRSFK